MGEGDLISLCGVSEDGVDGVEMGALELNSTAAIVVVY
jgi:hypothetical protein